MYASWTRTTIPLGPYFRRMLPICQAHSSGDVPSCLNHDYFTFISLLILCPWKSLGPLSRFPRPCGFASSAPDVGKKSDWEGTTQNLSTLANGSKNMALQGMFLGKIFSRKILAAFDVQVLFGCSNSSHAGLKERFDIANNCGDNDVVMVSPIYVSVIPPWLRLCIEAK